jgi:putative restriction endonuclease
VRLLGKGELLAQIINAVNESGWGVSFFDSPPAHPFRLGFFCDNESLNVRVYIWNMTHGGGPRSEHEYRIQITGVPAIEGEGGFRTLILGYWAAGEVFAGFDFNLHHGSIAYSPSLQIREEALRDAYINGFSPHSKGQGELAIAFRPDYFVEYCRNAESLHAFGHDTIQTTALEEISKESVEINKGAVELAPIERQQVLRKVAASHIAVQFRNRVLTAYGHRCAFCGIQLGLVEAAHIVPASPHSPVLRHQME